MSRFDVIPPGSVIGILGDGQLGRMIALAAARLGYRVAVLGPGGRESPAGQVVYWAKAWRRDGTVPGRLLAEFCSLVSVVLIEWENVSVELIERIERIGVPVRPSSSVLRVAQDRLFEKRLAYRLGILVPGFESVSNEQEAGVVKTMPSILKTRRDGYDGRGQVRISAGGSVSEAWERLGRVPCILEEVIDFACEISMIVARVPQEPRARNVVYGPFENTHESGILRSTRYPASEAIRAATAAHAEAAALKLAEELDVHGLLAVELFVTKLGEVVFNEMAPRPHNSGHLTLDCMQTCQFEQYVRAACNQPFGSMRVLYSGRMCNLLGDEACNGVFRSSGAVHLYGKHEARPGRKMGHVTELGID